MAAPTITTLPDAPTRDQTPGQFADDADAFVAALPTFVSEANTLAQFCEDEADDAETAKTAAEAAQSAAEAAQTAAEGVSALTNYQGTWSAGSYDTGESVYHASTSKFYISDTDANTAEPPAAGWRAIVLTDKSTDGGFANSVYTVDQSVDGGTA